jgi:hypothetical protein
MNKPSSVGWLIILWERTGSGPKKMWEHVHIMTKKMAKNAAVNKLKEDMLDSDVVVWLKNKAIVVNGEGDLLLSVFATLEKVYFYKEKSMKTLEQDKTYLCHRCRDLTVTKVTPANCETCGEPMTSDNVVIKMIDHPKHHGVKVIQTVSKKVYQASRLQGKSKSPIAMESKTFTLLWKAVKFAKYWN